jgi:hypothetical protein
MSKSSTTETDAATLIAADTEATSVAQRVSWAVARGSSIVDVAEYILRQHGEMSTMKLQKLLYYCQGWSLAWTGEPLFPEDFEAWASGPVCRALQELHQGEYSVAPGFFTAKIAELRAQDLEKRRVRRAPAMAITRVAVVAAALMAFTIWANRRRA